MGYGSAGTPAWVDDRKLDQEKREQEIAEYVNKIQRLEKENKTLQTRIKKLEEELHRAKKPQ